MEKSKILRILIILLVVLLIAFSAISILKKRKQEVNNLQTPQEPEYVVSGAIVKKGEIYDKKKYLGEIVPANEVEISTKIAGYIEKVYVNEGNLVKKGQLLVSVDDTEAKLTIDNLKINQEEAKNQLNSLQESLKSAQANYEFAKTNFERDKRLFEGKAISEIQYLQSKTQYETAKANVESIKSNIEALKNKVKSVGKQIEIATDNLKYLNIYSNIDGIVSKVLLREGNMALVGKPILKIQSLDNKILLKFPKEYVGKIKENDIAIVDFNGVKQELKISKIYPSADENNLAVAEIYLGKLPENTISNSFINVSVITGKVEGLLVPKNAILEMTNGTFVVVNKNGIFTKIPVKVIASDEENAVIEGDIPEGTPVAVGMENKLRLLTMGKKGKILLEGGNK